MRKGFVWYFKRFKKMGPYELIHRAFELAYCFYDRFYFRNGWRDNGNFLDLVQINNNEMDLTFHKDSLSSLFKPGYPSIIDFKNTDFFKYQRIPQHVDLRVIWESSRFNDLLLDSLNDNHADLVLSKLRYWMDCNRPLCGVNYVSTMECAIRCINLYAVLVHFSKKNIELSNLENIASQFFYTNYIIIKHRISKYSSRGNHTLFEYCGLAACTNALGMHKESRYWVEKADIEFDFQTNIDGSGIEQSTGYHLFNVEALSFLINYLGLIVKPAGKYHASIKFLSSFWLDDKIVRVGDSDSSVLFTHIFVIEQIKSVSSSIGTVNYSDCGIFSSKTGAYSFLFKYGNLGMAPLFGHGHYNFLSLIICDGRGQLVTADDQTYRYSAKCRSELRSSSGHSMPMFSSDDIRQISPFSWGEGRTGHLLFCGTKMVSAEYVRADEKGLKRTVESHENCILIVDENTGVSTDEEFVVNWNVLNPNVDFSFFVISSDGETTPVSSFKSKTRFSSSYNNFDSRQILRESVHVKSTSKLITVISFSDSICFDKLLLERFIS
jgi:hypothetical protein